MEFKSKKIIYVIAIFILAILANYPYHLSLNKLAPNDSMFFFYIHEFQKISIMKFHQFPQWIPYYFGGMPFFANAQSMIFTISGVLSLIFSAEAAINLTFIIELFLAGIFMYLLALELLKKEQFAFVSAILYMFNGWSMHHIVGSGLERFSVYFWLPLIFLFCLKAFNEKRYLRYSALTGIFLAIAFHGSGIDTFLWFSLVIGLFFFFQLFFSKDKKKLIVKIIAIGAVMLIVLLGLVAIKVLPLLEFSDFTNKKEGFSFDDSFEQSLSPSNAFKMFILKGATGSYPINIGIVASILVILGLFRIKNRFVLFFVIAAFLNILIAMNKQFYYPLWRFIPGFSAQHDVTRSLFIVAFSCCIIAGFGMSLLFKSVESKFKGSTIKIAYIMVILIILFELNVGVNVFQKNLSQQFSFREQISNNYLFQNISKEEGLFRIHNIGTSAIGGVTGAYAIPLGVNILYGYNNVWIPEYFNEYLAIAYRSPSRFYGMLNAKWIYSDKEINKTGLNFVKKFEKCEDCYGDNIDAGVDGPYLYYNEEYLPRGYMINTTILVVGYKNTSKEVMYSLMLKEGFNPSEFAVILGKESLSEYNQNELDRFKIIILTSGSVNNNNDLTVAKEFVKSGGYLFPDVTNQIFSYDINNVLSVAKEISLNNTGKKVSMTISEIPITKFSPNEISFKTSGEKGFLIISEKFFMFNGWKTKDTKERILRANGINSAIYLDGTEENLNFVYMPRTFIYGLVIFFITVAGLIIFFILDKRKFKEEDIKDERV